MTKLTDTQLIVLTAAAGRDDGSVHPLPETLKGGAADKVVGSLLRKGLVEKIVDERPAVADIYKITRVGLLAINADPDEGARTATVAQATQAGTDAPRTGKKATTRRRRAAKPAPAERPAAAKPKGAREGTKQAALIAMLRRPEGATVEQMVEATGWQRHTVRGAISGALKKKLGLTVTSEKTEGARIYRIVEPA